MKLIHSVTLLLSLLSNEASAFTNSLHTTPLSRHAGTNYDCNSSPSSLLMAGKKRRRRKSSSSIITNPSDDDDALPDFDDAEDDIVMTAEQAEVAAASSTLPTTTTNQKSSPPTQIKKGTGLNPQLAEELGGNVSGLDEELILESMRGKTSNTGGDSNWVPPSSIKETLADRSLEELMNFDKMIEQDGGGGGGNERVDLPEFDDVIARRKARLGENDNDGGVDVDTTGMGKKAAKAAQRKALAIQREAELEAEKSPFDDLNILKLLENGAWVGIGLLVLWEFYINSPFFDRAMPLIPVVYDDVPPGM